MPKPLYYLTFRRRTFDTSTPGKPIHTGYGPQATVFTESAPREAYRELKAAGLAVAYGREGDAPTRDSHPDELWDTSWPYKPPGP
jgi:hypothetical protein